MSRRTEVHKGSYSNQARTPLLYCNQRWLRCDTLKCSNLINELLLQSHAIKFIMGINLSNLLNTTIAACLYLIMKLCLTPSIYFSMVIKGLVGRALQSFQPLAKARSVTFIDFCEIVLDKMLLFPKATEQSNVNVKTYIMARFSNI